MTVAELEDRMSSSEFTEWQAFYAIRDAQRDNQTDDRG